MGWKKRAERCRAISLQVTGLKRPTARKAPGVLLRAEKRRVARIASWQVPRRLASATRQGRDRRFAAGELRPGPHDYATAMDDWAPEQRRALAEDVPGSMVQLQEVIGRGIDVTTHYSGIGAAEMACAAIAPGQVKFHGACDFNPTCRKVLIHHGAESAAEHVTTDLCERLPPHLLEELRAELRTHQDKLLDCHSPRASTSSRAPEPEVVKAIGLQWVASAMRILSQWVPAREDGAYCCRHLRHCPTFPPRSKRFHLEIDGINCQPWSVQGKALGWLDERSIPCLILVQTILSIEPDAVCIECTPRFDFATLQNLLPTYRGDWAITCPTDFGRPVARQRMYMWFDRRASLRRVHAEVSGILDVSRRTVRVEAGIFLQASQAEIRREYPPWAISRRPVLRRLVGKQLAPAIPVFRLLAGGMHKRYVQHRDKVAKVRRSSDACFLVDINQAAAWAGRADCRKVPTLLRSSKLVAVFESPEKDRLLLPSEVPAVHGLRLPAQAMAMLTPREVCSMIGNSMHVAQIGCFLVYALSTRSYVL